jgi:hypothetical protein
MTDKLLDSFRGAAFGEPMTSATLRRRVTARDQDAWSPSAAARVVSAWRCAYP